MFRKKQQKLVLPLLSPSAETATTETTIGLSFINLNIRQCVHRIEKFFVCFPSFVLFSCNYYFFSFFKTPINQNKQNERITDARIEEVLKQITFEEPIAKSTEISYDLSRAVKVLSGYLRYAPNPLLFSLLSYCIFLLY